MRKVALRLTGLLLLIGLLAMPATALAAPEITITPQEGPNSTLFVVTGVGFAPSTTYYLRIVSADGATEIEFDDPSTQSDSDGIILSGFSFGGNVPAGNYVASIATAAVGGQVVAKANFALTGVNGTPAGPNIVITPSQGPAGDLFILTGTGFTPNTTYSLRVQSENRQTTINFNNSDLDADEDGVIISGFSLSTSRNAGVYIAEVLTKSANPTVVAGTTFTLTASGASPSPSPSTAPSPSPSTAPSPSPSTAPSPVPSPVPSPMPSPMPSPVPSPVPSPLPSPPPTGNGGFLPGLPNTGAGGMSDGGSGSQGQILAALGLVASSALALGVVMRRRMH